MTAFYDISTKAVVVMLKAYNGMTSQQVADTTGVSKRQVDRIYKRACDLGFDSAARPLVF